jgi:hypothetical protein
LHRKIAEENFSPTNLKKAKQLDVFQSPRRPGDYPGYRGAAPDSTANGTSMPILIGAAMIAAAIVLSTLITSLGTRYVGFESPTEESAWLVDRLTGSVYKCQASAPGKASCEAETATGSIGPPPKR